MGADSELPSDKRFISRVVKLIRQRRAQIGADLDPAIPSVFLLESKPRPRINSSALPKRIPMLDTGRTVINGRVWFVNPALTMGYCVSIEDCNDDDDKLFRVVTDELQVGQVPAIVFEPRTRVPEARYYPNGLADLEDVQVVKITYDDVSLEQVFEVITRVVLGANSKSSALWEDHLKYWPAENVEDTLREQVVTGLWAAFGNTCTIRHEYTHILGVAAQGDVVDQISQFVEQRSVQILREKLASYFSMSQLRSLCADLGINHEMLSVENLGDMVLELVAEVERTGHINKLLQRCQELRPHVDWNTTTNMLRTKQVLPKCLDIVIEESDLHNPAHVMRHAILELMILRSYLSNGGVITEQATLNWLEFGVRQTGNFRENRGARLAALCCFDMRQENNGEQCFVHVAELANHLDVKLKHWHIYATAERAYS